MADKNMGTRCLNRCHPLITNKCRVEDVYGCIICSFSEMKKGMDHFVSMVTSRAIHRLSGEVKVKTTSVPGELISGDISFLNLAPHQWEISKSINE